MNTTQNKNIPGEKAELGLVANKNSAGTKGRLGEKAGFIFVPIYATTNRGKPIWQVPLGRVAGRRLAPKTFRTLQEARDFARALARGLVNDHAAFGRIDAEGLSAAALIGRLIEPFCSKLRIGIDQAIEEYIGAKERAGSRVLADLIQEYRSLPWIAKSRTPIGDAVEMFIAAKRKKGCRPETIRCLLHTLNPVVLKVNNAPVVEVTTEDLNKVIHRPNCAPRGNKTVYCSLHNFYVWLRKNGYLRSDIPSAMDPVEPPLVDDVRPEIIDVESARRAIQKVVADLDPEYVLNFVLALFTGIRTDEMQGLQWNDVSPGERILVPSGVDKNRGGRHVPIQPVLDAWIRPFYGRSGFINSRKDPLLKIALTLKQIGILWKRDWLRHSYCSYRLAATGDLSATAKEDGHSPEILVRRYLKLVTKSEAEAYFALTPAACGIDDWDQRVAAFLANRPECHQLRKRGKRDKQKETAK